MEERSTSGQITNEFLSLRSWGGSSQLSEEHNTVVSDESMPVF